MITCPHCGTEVHHECPGTIPPEPPLGTWVKDRHGGVALHHIDGDNNEGWSPPGCYAFGRWEAMWRARGPLVVCEPWGRG